MPAGEWDEVQAELRRQPGDLATWRRTLRTAARRGSLARGVELVRDALALMGKQGAPEFFRCLVEERFGYGDPRLQYPTAIDRLLLAPDGSRLAVLLKDGTGHVLETRAFTEIGQVRAPDPFGIVAFSRDGGALGSLGPDRQASDGAALLLRWTFVEQARPRLAAFPLPGLMAEGPLIGLGLDAGLALAAGRSGVLVVGDTATGTIVRFSVPGEVGPPVAAHVSPDGSLLVVEARLPDRPASPWLDGSGNETHVLAIFDRTGTVLGTEEITVAGTAKILWPQEGTAAVAVWKEVALQEDPRPHSDDYFQADSVQALLFDAARAHVRWRWRDGGSPRRVGLGRDGRLVIRDCSLDLVSGEGRRSHDDRRGWSESQPGRPDPGPGEPEGGLLPAGLVVHQGDQVLCVDRPKRPGWVSGGPLGHGSPLRSLHLVGGGALLLAYSRHLACVWCTRTGAMVQSCPALGGAHLPRMLVPRSGGWLARTTRDGWERVDLEGPAAPVPLRLPKEHGFDHWHDLSPDGSRLLCAGQAGRLSVLELATGSVVAELAVGSSHGLARFLETDPGLAYTASAPGLLSVWSLGSGRKVASWALEAGWGGGADGIGVREDPLGGAILVARPGTPYRYPMDGGKPEPLLAKARGTGPFAVSTRGDLVALVSEGHRVEVWSRREGGPAGGVPLESFRPELGDPPALAFSATGDVLGYAQLCHVRMHVLGPIV